MFSVTLFIAIALVTVTPSCLAYEDNDQETATTILQPFLGTRYELVTNDLHYADVLMKLGVNTLRIIQIMFSSPDLELAWDSDEEKFTLSETCYVYNETATFQMEKRMNRTTANGRSIDDVYKVSSVPQVTLWETQYQTGKPPVQIMRVFTENYVAVKIQIEELVAYRLFAAKKSKLGVYNNLY